MYHYRSDHVALTGSCRHFTGITGYCRLCQHKIRQAEQSPIFPWKVRFRLLLHRENNKINISYRKNRSPLRGKLYLHRRHLMPTVPQQRQPSPMSSMILVVHIKQGTQQSRPKKLKSGVQWTSPRGKTSTIDKDSQEEIYECLHLCRGLDRLWHVYHC